MVTKLHIDNWITKAEPDYYTMFIKAWIPFNAWYFTEYGTKKDSEAISKIKGTNNKIKNRIKALLDNNGNESKNFRLYLAQLHLELINRNIMNYNKSVSFKHVILEDYMPTPATDTDKKGNIYKAIPDKSAGYRAIIIDKNNKTLMDRTFNPYPEDFNIFLTDNQYITLLDGEIKEKIQNCFKKIDPQKPINLISDSNQKNGYILLDDELEIKFINDTELIAKALIQILYTLRCLLFHGELDPTDINRGIYEHAFNLLRILIKELK
ncbi:hypothetical protein EZS27_006244 [termite gut metagenome]|uniref:Apea-like HEPN domain-containing protein n=1 Tax=termite gut metagenome TaxID=433724 RepID=A0A5J4SJZ5_9ZZZZ